MGAVFARKQSERQTCDVVVFRASPIGAFDRSVGFETDPVGGSEILHRHQSESLGSDCRHGKGWMLGIQPERPVCCGQANACVGFQSSLEERGSQAVDTGELDAGPGDGFAGLIDDRAGEGLGSFEAKGHLDDSLHRCRDRLHQGFMNGRDDSKPDLEFLVQF